MISLFLLFLDFKKLKGLQDEFFSHLNDEEKKYTQQFENVERKTQFIFTRGCLRKFLTQRFGIHRENMVFKPNPYGKPQLFIKKGEKEGQSFKNYNHLESLCFNISHWQNHGCIAVCASPDLISLGVDIQGEKKNSNPLSRWADPLRLAERFLTPQERDLLLGIKALNLSSLPTYEDVFLKIWVRKEALIKALGGPFLKIARIFQVMTLKDAHAPDALSIPWDSEQDFNPYFKEVQNFSLASLKKDKIFQPIEENQNLIAHGLDFKEPEFFGSLILLSYGGIINNPIQIIRERIPIG